MTQQHMLKHILFDNDGTLVDTEIIAVRSSLRLLRQYGFEMSEQEYSHRFPGMLERDILASLERDHGLQVPDNYLEMVRADHRKAFQEELRAIPGMTSLFRQLRLPKSMVSNASVTHIEHCLRKVRLRNALDGHIFSAEHVSHPKPRPDVYLLALETLRLHPHEVVVVEDSPVGVAAASQAGLTVVGFLGAAHIHDGHDERLLEAGAQAIAPDARALREWLAARGAF